MSDESDVDSPFCRRSKSSRLRDVKKDSHNLSNHRDKRLATEESIQASDEEEFHSASEELGAKHDSWLSDDESTDARHDNGRRTPENCVFEESVNYSKSSRLLSSSRRRNCSSTSEDSQASGFNNKSTFVEREATSSRNRARTTNTRSSSGSSDSESDLRYLNSLRTKLNLEADHESSSAGEDNERQSKRRLTDSFIVPDDEVESSGSPNEMSNGSEGSDASFAREEDASEEESSDEEDEEEDFELAIEVVKPKINTPKKPRSSELLNNLKQSFCSPSLRKPSTDEHEHFLLSLDKNYRHARHSAAEDFLAKSFTKIREALVGKIFEHVNLSCFKNKLPMDLPIIWNTRMRKTAGYCKLQKRRGANLTTISRSVTVELSTKVLTTADRCRDTLIHELCHAAVFLIDEVDKDHHGPYWNKWAKVCMKRHPKLPFISRCHNYDIKAKYLYKCSGCGQEVKRHSRSLDTTKKICGVCRGRFELQVLVRGEYKRRSLTAKRSPNKDTFAAFVKLHYGSVKTAGTTHKEAMQILSAKWKGQKAQEMAAATSTDSQVRTVPRLVLDDCELDLDVSTLSIAD